jgi:hypothetical protein
MDHVARAREHLASGTETGLRHAALELRMAIERIAYRFLPLYSQELTDDILKGWNWQPKRILDALVDCNPGAEQDFTIRAAFRNPNGSPGPSVFRGKQQGLPRKLLSRNYDKLGSLVHVDPRGKPLDLPKMSKFAEATASRIEVYCQETTIVANGLAPAVTFTCQCGRVFRRNMAAVRINAKVRCPADSCAAVFDLTETSTGAVAVRHHETFVCPSCQAHTKVPSGAIPLHFNCAGCGERFIVDEGIFVRHDSEPE